jgi:hypothetical protein
MSLLKIHLVNGEELLFRDYDFYPAVLSHAVLYLAIGEEI